MKRSLQRLASTFAFALTFAVCGLAEGSDWTQWRGPEGTGFAADSQPPIAWSETENIRWKVEIPGSGHASPIVFGDRIFILTAVKTDQVVETSQAEEAPAEEPRHGGRRGRGGRGGFGGQKPTNVYQYKVLAIDRHSGSVIWEKTVREQVPHEGTHRTATFASISPVTDGEHIYAFFGSGGLYCLDMDGNVTWEKDMGKMRIRMSFGEGASPALHGDTLIVRCDHEGDSFVAALDKSTGEEKWKVDRDEHSTWATPVIVEVNGRNQVILAATGATVSYDLETGDEVWRCSGLTMNVIPTPVIGHGMVYLMSGFRGNALQAVKLDAARGDITDSEAIIWTHDRGTPYTPSPLLAGRNLYFLGSNNGILSCFDAVTGEAHYTGQRLDEVRNVYSSPVGAGGHIYVCGREGNVAVIEDGPEFKLVATNSLDEGINASPAIVGDEIFLRGDKHLFCIGKTGE